MAVNLVPPSLALVQQRQFEQGPNISALAGERDEQRDVRGVVLGALAVGVEVDRPLVATDDERVGGDVLPDAYALGQRETPDLELVEAIDGLGPRRRGREIGRRRRRRQR